MKEASPRAHIARWLPHALVWSAVGLGVWLVLAVFEPLREPLLLGVAIAALTYPVVFEPIDRLAARLLPKMKPRSRRGLTSMLATSALVGLILVPPILMVISTIGDLRAARELLIGVGMRDPVKLQQLHALVVEQVARIETNFSVPLDGQQLADTVIQFVSEARNFAPTFLSFLFRGTGSALAQVVLAAVVSTFCYANGPQLVDRLLSFSPLTPEQSTMLQQRHRRAILRLLYDTVGAAFVKGLVFGLIMLVFAHLFDLGLFQNFVLTTVLAAFISLVPAVGVSVVWVPMALVLWGDEKHVAAAVLAALCFGANTGVDKLLERFGKRFGKRSSWMGLMLFLGLIGGVLQYGVVGFVVGPTVVVITAVLGSFWLPLYGVGSFDELAGAPESES